MAWDDWRVFLAMARTGSRAQAARALDVDPTTISRRIAALEAELGLTLFDRTGNGLVLGASGRAVLARAERIEEEIAAAERELQGRDERASGPVRLTAGDGLVHYVLVPALAELRRVNPAITVELRADTRVLDLSRREADVAVRLVRPKEPALFARRIGTMTFALYASARYLERRGPLRAARDLAVHDFIGFEAGLDHVPQVRWLTKLVAAPRWVVRANTTGVQVVACAEGHGVALLPTFVEAHEAGLQRVLPRLVGPTREMWAVTHGDVRKNERVVRVNAWLDATLSAHPSFGRAIARR